MKGSPRRSFTVKAGNEAVKGQSHEADAAPAQPASTPGINSAFTSVLPAHLLNAGLRRGLSSGVLAAGSGPLRSGKKTSALRGTDDALIHLNVKRDE